MKKPTSKKLQLAGETVRALRGDQLVQVAGGQRPTTSIMCSDINCTTSDRCER